MGLVVGLADDIGHAQLLQVHGSQHGSRQIAANGDDSAVEIPGTQRPQDLLVLSVAHHRVGHVVGHLLHQIAALIQRQHLRAQCAQLPGKGLAEPAKTDYNV